MNSAIERLLGLPKFGTGIGLHRMEHLLAEPLAGSWGRGLDAIRVTGSNGKGSTSAMTAAILDETGLRSGLYTSPHLLRFNERIQVAGTMITDAEITAAAAGVFADIEACRAEWPDDEACAFEAFTALALRHFAATRPDAVVAEAGLGGRYDSVRALPGRLVALTSLDLEHAEILGASLELIAYDKADLCPAGGTLVVGRIDPGILRRLRSYCRLRQVELVALDDTAEPEAIDLAGPAMTVDLTVAGTRFERLEIALAGRHQADNAALAILLASRWLERRGRGGLADSAFRAAVRRALARVGWPGRLQRISDSPPVYIDVGHTPDAIRTIVEWAATLRADGRELLLVTGASYNKKVAEIVTALAAAADRVVCTRAHHRGADAAAVEAVVAASHPDKLAGRFDSVETAMPAALALAGPATVILVAGGLFLAVEAWETLRGGDPRALRFF